MSWHRLKGGADFAALAKKYSTDPGSRDKGGELGWFRKGGLTAAFEAYAFAAPIGKTSPPIRSPFGYHIIQVEERKPARRATLAEVRAQIVQALREQSEGPLAQPFLASLQRSAKIEVSDARFADLFSATSR